MTKMGSKKSKKPIKRKVKSQGVIKRRLDIMFSKYVRDKANNTCEFCGGKEKRMECHHGVVHRRYMNTRYEESNCVCLCSSCHRFFNDFPHINTDFFNKRIGEDKVEKLGIRARTQGKKVDLIEIEQELKNKIKESVK